MHPFDPGYAQAPYADLVGDYPGPEIYPAKDFRVEWGPIFHRGRLDGTARVLVIGQDPAAHEAITRRILVGTAGRRFQGFLNKLGIDSSYVLINTFLYSVYGQRAGTAHATDPDIARYRHAWLDALVTHNQIEAVIALGGLADSAFHTWRKAPTSAAYDGAYEHILHPTYPDSAAASGSDAATAMKQLTTNWNNALTALNITITPDTERSVSPYGDSLTPADLGTIPEADLPPGLPAWMRSDEPWAARQGSTPAEKRATITVQIPEDQRPF
ncbi:Uracil DNA glycosylase superfamily protein [Streptomyces sp. 3213]|uniref:uracil-DNA glycosylase family protein n=1 Tax=Streptomyces sp. 3213.3 TaxID=1855348 RepID=UPI00089460B7|nr:uracil-DNA glycosylase family protein [Streptomyces sp. 3213.3]SED64460.1 Uracil DNA glycosylase superfamily protein [Streptomyces sp. 3213] [Streptomyces sp. 3213.3]